MFGPEDGSDHAERQADPLGERTCGESGETVGTSMGGTPVHAGAGAAGMWSSRARDPSPADAEQALLAPPGQTERSQLWSDFARCSSTGLVLVRTDAQAPDDPRRATVVAANPAAQNLLGHGILIGASLDETLGPSLEPDDWADMAAGLAGWGPQQIRVELGPTVLNVRLHHQPGHVALAIDDATHGQRIERSLALQAQALAERDRETRALLDGLGRRLERATRRLTRAVAGVDDGGRVGRFDPFADAFEELRDAVALISDLAGGDEHTAGRVELSAVLQSAIAAHQLPAGPAGLRVQSSALPAIWGIRREVQQVVDLLVRHFVTDGRLGPGRVLRASATATRSGWRLTLSEVASARAAAASGPPPPDMSADAEFCLAACQRLMRRGRGELGRSAGGDGAVSVWVEWPGHGPAARLG